MRPKVCTFVKSGTKPDHFPPADLPEVAFAGRSNVGKSSLLNSAMYRKDLVKVSQTPGRTRLLSWFDVDARLRLCDLPGYGYAKVGGGEQLAWQSMIETYLQKREVLRALAILVDVRRGFE
jgi:GTP-binding protein